MLQYLAVKTQYIHGAIMDEEVFNIQLRKFLKKVGIQSQREIEHAVRSGVESGVLAGNEKLEASVLLRVPGVSVEVTIKDDIALS